MVLFLVVEEAEVEGWSTRSPLVNANTLVRTLVAQHSYILSGFPLSQPWMCNDKVKPGLTLPLSPVPEIQLKVFFLVEGGCWIQVLADLETTKGAQLCRYLLCAYERWAPLAEGGGEGKVKAPHIDHLWVLCCSGERTLLMWWGRKSRRNRSYLLLAGFLPLRLNLQLTFFFCSLHHADMDVSLHWLVFSQQTQTALDVHIVIFTAHMVFSDSSGAWQKGITHQQLNSQLLGEPGMFLKEGDQLIPSIALASV